LGLTAADRQFMSTNFITRLNYFSKDHRGMNIAKVTKMRPAPPDWEIYNRPVSY